MQLDKSSSIPLEVKMQLGLGNIAIGIFLAWGSMEAKLVCIKHEFG